MTRGAISKLADRLLAKKLITRQAMEGDGRSQMLGLTARGRALVPELAALADRNDEEFFGELAASARKGIVNTMKDIVHRRELKMSRSIDRAITDQFLANEGATHGHP